MPTLRTFSGFVKHSTYPRRRSTLRWRRHQVDPDIANPFDIVSLAWAVGTAAYFSNHPALVCAQRTARGFWRLAVDADMKRHIS
jgi:hypothetical protein